MTPAAPRARHVLAAWGLRAQRLRLVSDTDAQVWRVRSDDDTPRDLALRVYADAAGKADALDAELDWLRDLAADGLHVPTPLPLPDGRWRLPLPGGHAVVLHWLHGQQRFNSLRPLHLRRVGVFIAHLHHSAQRRESAGVVRHAQPVGGSGFQRLTQHSERLHAWCGQPLADAVLQAMHDLAQQQSSWPRDPMHWGWIHGDLHPWNLLFQRDRAGAIDFSDAGWGFRAQDLAAVLQFLRHPLEGWADHRARFLPLREALFSGYASVRPLPASMCQQADALHAQRLLNTLQWMLEDWAAPSDRPWGAAFVRVLPHALHELRAAVTVG